jgi:hypothetical protein
MTRLSVSKAKTVALRPTWTRADASAKDPKGGERPAKTAKRQRAPGEPRLHRRAPRRGVAIVGAKPGHAEGGGPHGSGDGDVVGVEEAWGPPAESATQ